MLSELPSTFKNTWNGKLEDSHEHAQRHLALTPAHHKLSAPSTNHGNIPSMLPISATTQSSHDSANNQPPQIFLKYCCFLFCSASVSTDFSYRDLTLAETSALAVGPSLAFSSSHLHRVTVPPTVKRKGNQSKRAFLSSWVKVEQ